MKNTRLKTVLVAIFALQMCITLVSCNGGEGATGVDDFLDMPVSGGGGSGGGGIGNSALTFDPATHNYGDVGTGGTGTRVFTVENTSGTTVFLDSISGTDANFTQTGTTCPIGTLVGFAGGDNCTITFDFSPATGGDFTTTINLNYGTSATDSSLVTSLTLQGSAGANAPTNYSLTQVTGTTADISWTDNSLNETNFQLERCDGITCATTFVTAFTTTVASNTTSYQFTGLTEGAYYRFRVRANTASSSSDWLTGSTMITFGGISSVVDNGTGNSDLTGLDCRTTPAGAYVILSWNAVTDATSYFVNDVTGGANTLLATVNAPTTSVILTGIDINTSKDFLVTVATSTGFNSQNTTSTNLTTTSYLPCHALGKPDPGDHTDGNSFFHPRDIEIFGTQMFVVDRYNNRVLIWNTIPTNGTTPADIVLGQPDLTTRYANNTPDNIGTTSAQSLWEPLDLWVGNIGGLPRLMVADWRNERVLIWNSIPTTNHQAANVVIGQPDMSSRINDGGNQTRGTDNPQGVWSDGTRVYVADTNNHRVMIFNSLPTTNFEAPDVILGQNNDTNTGANCGSNRMNTPAGGWSDGTRLFVAMTGCDRISIWEAIPGANVDPDTVLGQTSLTNTGANANSNRTRDPIKVTVEGGKIYVSDYSNNRVKVWNAIPAAGNHGVASDHVIGLSNTGNGGGAQQNRLDNPAGIAFSGTRAYVADSDNHRITVYDPVPTSNAENAIFQIGQPDFNEEVRNESSTIAENTFDSPYGIAYDSVNDQFFVSDREHHRILVWSGIPTSYNQNANFVIGQGNFNTSGAARTQSTLNSPRGICVADNKLWVADTGNRRVMVFNLPITGNGINASGVLGQTAYNTNTNGNGLDRMTEPYDCHSDGTRFFVVDRGGNDRVLMWDTIPNLTTAADNPAADRQLGVLGNTTSQAGLRDPEGVYSDGTKLWVADTGNHRIMVWDPMPAAGSDVNASFYLGGGATFNDRPAGVTGAELNAPRAITGNGTGKIYVLDESNERVMVWSAATTSGEPADEVYGVGNYTTNQAANNSVVNDNSASFSDILQGLEVINNRIFVGDYQNSRVIGVPVTP